MANEADARFLLSKSIEVNGKVEWLASDLLATAGVRLQF